MNNRKSQLNTILAYSAIGLTALVFTFLFFFIGISHRKSSYEDSKLIAMEVSRKMAVEIQLFFSSAHMTAQSLVQQSQILQKVGANRDEISFLLQNTLKENKNYLAIWTMWEPNAYDGMDQKYKGHSFADSEGHLSTTFFQYNGTILQEYTQPQDYLEDYYTTPKKTKSELIIEPYHYTYEGHTKEFYETSIVIPIFVDSVFAGVLGIDMNLDSIQKRLNNLRVLNNGYLSLISHDGVIVSHVNSNFINKNIFSIFNNADSISPRIIKSGVEYGAEFLSEFTGNKVFRFFYPIKFRSGERPWSIMVEIPVKEATIRSSQLLNIAIGTLVLGLSLIAYLVLNTIQRKKDQDTILTSLETIEKGNKIIANSEFRYQQVFNSTSEAIFIHDAKSATLLDVNDVMLKLYGYQSKQEVLHQSIGILTASSTPFGSHEASQYFKRIVSNGGQVFEWQAKRKDGSLFWVEVSLTGFIYENESRVIAVARDITEKKKTNSELEIYRNKLEFLVKERTEELATANEELSSINEELLNQRMELEATIENLNKTQQSLIQSEKMASLGLLAAGIAHEINNPLNFIQAGINAMEVSIKEHLPEYTYQFQPMFDGITEGVKRATNIVSSLRQYSRSGCNDMRTHDVHSVIDNCLVLLNNLIDEKNISISKEYSANPSTAKCNEGKLHQAFLNVISNAVQSVNQSGHITLKTFTNMQSITIQFIDNGCGIKQDNLNKLFEPFFTTKDPGEGTGLGLFITYNIIQEHNGSIDVDSIEGEGTNVSITIPNK